MQVLLADIRDSRSSQAMDTEEEEEDNQTDIVVFKPEKSMCRRKWNEMMVF